MSSKTPLLSGLPQFKRKKKIMAYSGSIFGIPYHQGSWLGLPDFGLSEKTPTWAQNTIGAPLPQQPQQTPPQQNTGSISTASTVPISTKPVPTQSQPQQQQNTSGNFMDYYQNWPEAAARQDFNQVFGGDIERLKTARGVYSNGGQSGPSQADLDAIYNPQFNALSDTENFLTNQLYPSTLTSIDEATKQQQDVLAQNKSQLETDYQNQTDTLGQQKTQTSADAMRNYNALQQQAMARFGQGSSTGGAVSELNQNEYLRNSGRMEIAFQNQIKSLTDQKMKGLNWVMSEGSRIQTSAAEQKRQAMLEYQTRILDVKNNRAQLEGQKAASQLQIARELIANVQRIEDAKKTALIQLDVWKQQQDYLVQKGLSDLSSQYQQMISSNIFQNDQATLTQAPQQSQISAPVNYIANKSQAPDDLFTNLVNPFA